ncbi:shikimate dehydrogenase, partial [Microcystis aeruginosa]
MSNETVTYSLESVLKEIKDSIKEVNQKMDTLQKDVNDLKVGQAKLTEKVEGMDKRLEKVENEQYTLVKAISDLQGFRGLIVPIL